MESVDDLFLVNGPLWFVAPSPRPAELASLCRSMVRNQEAGRGFVPVFTDTDLAERFIAQCTLPNLKAFTFPTRRELAIALEQMVEVGITHLGFDPGPNHVRRIPIERVLEGIRRGPI